MMRPFATMRPSRLFWKLFIAFLLASGTSFLIGAGLFELGKPNAVNREANIDTTIHIVRLIQDRGIAAARPLLRVQEPAGNLMLVRADQTWVAGARDVASDSLRLNVVARDGGRYQLLIRPPPNLRFNRTAPLLIGTFVSLFFSAGLAWYLARPITHLSRGFQAIAAGRLSTRVHPLVGTRRDEIADLTRDFDGMAAQLQHLLATQERLFHDVSHELRSPLTRLQLAIGLLRQSPDKLPDMLMRVEREAERLNHLIEELLTLARLKSSTEEFETSPVDLIDLLTAIVDDARFEGRAKGCDIRYLPSAPFVTMGNGDLLYRAFENVVRNAVKFSPVSAPVEVTADVSADRAVVRISDRGRGVPAEMLVDIFEPFKRVDDDADVTGFGLGLAIAKYAVERHGGSIHARRGEEGGLMIEIVLPRHAASF